MTDQYRTDGNVVIDPEDRIVAIAVSERWAVRLAEALTTHERVLAARAKAGIGTGEQRQVIPLDQIRRAREAPTEVIQRVGGPLTLVPPAASGWGQATESLETTRTTLGEPLRVVPPLPEQVCYRESWHECELYERRWMKH